MTAPSKEPPKVEVVTLGVRISSTNLPSMTFTLDEDGDLWIKQGADAILVPGYVIEDFKAVVASLSGTP